MTLLGTALRPAATRVMLLGSGELGKEVAIVGAKRKCRLPAWYKLSGAQVASGRV